jgi:formate dehydrogenase subunit gamma
MKLALCRAENCARHGAGELAQFAQTLLDIGWHETTPDGAVTLLPVECIGLCNGAPCGAADGRSLVRLNAAKLSALLRSAPGGRDSAWAE